MDRVSSMRSPEDIATVKRVFLNDEIITVKSEIANQAANQVKIRSEIARLKAMVPGIKY